MHEIELVQSTQTKKLNYVVKGTIDLQFEIKAFCYTMQNCQKIRGCVSYVSLQKVVTI